MGMIYSSAAIYGRCIKRIRNTYKHPLEHLWNRSLANIEKDELFRESGIPKDMCTCSNMPTRRIIFEIMPLASVSISLFYIYNPYV